MSRLVLVIEFHHNRRMNMQSDIFDRIRNKKKKAPVQDAQAQSHPPCDHPGCFEKAPYKAPKGRNQTDSYFHFCLDHVKAYNKSYDYFQGMPDNAIVDFQKDAVTGHRPTWTMGLNPGGKTKPKSHNPLDYIHTIDPLGFASEVGIGKRPIVKPEKAISKEEKFALATLELDIDATKQCIRSRYKALVKKHHPDANGGKKENEELLRKIIDAYNTLKSHKWV